MCLFKFQMKEPCVYATASHSSANFECKSVGYLWGSLLKLGKIVKD